VDTYIDIHTHQVRSGENVIAVSNQMLHERGHTPTQLFSAGLHPWHADQLSPESLSEALDHAATYQNMIAYGETGLDKVCEIPLKLQQDVFELHLRKAVKWKKPVILHCVKAWDELIEIAAGYHLLMILHGYNGSNQLTERLLQRGFCFSIGKSILNPASKIRHSIHLIPPSSLFCETDTSEISIQSIYAAVSSALKIEEKKLIRCILNNFNRLRHT